MYRICGGRAVNMIAAWAVSKNFLQKSGCENFKVPVTRLDICFNLNIENRPISPFPQLNKTTRTVTHKIKLKNADDSVLLDANVYEWLTTDPYLSSVDFINNLRKHSSGCAVFQKTWKKSDGGFKTETIYLHKLIAEKFLADTKTKERRLVGAKNGDKLDCRLENVTYRSRSVASRMRKTSSKTGFTGVYREHNRYRAVISVHGKSVHIGMFDTPEEAAAAYNKLSSEVYGPEGKLNKLG